jgi:rhomboid protease GluP
MPRKTEGAIVCPHCGKLISVSEPTCPFCGAWRPGLYGWAPALQNLFGQRLNLVSIIVTSCIALYAASLLLQPEEAFSGRGGVLSLLSPGRRALMQLGSTGWPTWHLGWWWTVFTAIFLHGSLLHIFFNVMWIRDLGPVVTELYGPARAFVIFMIAGATGFLVSNLASGAPTIGASGSIFGLLAALIVYGRRSGSSMMSTQIWQWAIVLFFMGFVLPSVNNWAHGGGFAGGWLAATFMRQHHERRESTAMFLIALLLIGVTAVGVVLSFVKVTAAALPGA